MYTGKQKIVKHFAKLINYWMIYQEMETKGLESRNRWWEICQGSGAAGSMKRTDWYTGLTMKTFIFCPAGTIINNNLY